MPYQQSEWWRYINDVAKEYEASRVALTRLTAQARADANVLADEPKARNGLSRASDNLEGTYLVRLFAAFESALRSYERWWHPGRVGETRVDASQMIDEIGARNADDVPRRRKRAIGTQIRDRVHQVRRSRNFWAHDDADAIAVPMSLERAKSCLLEYIAKMPLEWGD
jgi:hypothetical protein